MVHLKNMHICFNTINIYLQIRYIDVMINCNINKYAFSTSFIFLVKSVTIRNSIYINPISVFNNQPCMNYKDMEII